MFRYEHAGADAFTLTVPEFSVEPGEVVAVVGRVGAGKSALLQALLGNVPLAQGSMRVGGRVAYVPQVRAHACGFDWSRPCECCAVPTNGALRQRKLLCNSLPRC